MIIQAHMEEALFNCALVESKGEVDLLSTCQPGDKLVLYRLDTPGQNAEAGASCFSAHPIA